MGIKRRTIIELQGKEALLLKNSCANPITLRSSIEGTDWKHIDLKWGRHTNFKAATRKTGTWGTLSENRSAGRHHLCNLIKLTGNEIDGYCFWYPPSILLAPEVALPTPLSDPLNWARQVPYTLPTPHSTHTAKGQMSALSLAQPVQWLNCNWPDMCLKSHPWHSETKLQLGGTNSLNSALPVQASQRSAPSYPSPVVCSALSHPAGTCSPHKGCLESAWPWYQRRLYFWATQNSSYIRLLFQDWGG